MSPARLFVQPSFCHGAFLLRGLFFEVHEMKRCAAALMLLGVLLLGACASDGAYETQSTPRARSSHQH